MDQKENIHVESSSLHRSSSLTPLVTGSSAETPATRKRHSKSDSLETELTENAAARQTPPSDLSQHVQTQQVYVQVDQTSGVAVQAPRNPNIPEGWDEEDLEDLQHYLRQVYSIIKPVMICIIMVVWWVKVDQAANQAVDSSTNNALGFGVTLYNDPNATSGQIFTQAVVNALIIIAVIIGVTILFVVLFYFGFHKFLYGYLMLSTALAYIATAGLLIWDQLVAINITVDYLTIAFSLWNFAVVGLCSIFWKGPLYIQQFYLIAISALVAWSLTKIDQWTTWVLLVLLVIWDLVAVLTPCGPLRVLIESSHRQNVQIPALLYSVTMIYFMAQPGEPTNSSFNDDHIQTERQKTATRIYVQPVEQSSLAPASPPEQQQQPQQQVQRQEMDDEDEERAGLKLGLGDFVFYSVLVARAALNDWTSLVACIVSVLFGLAGTILLLAMVRRALPALPISLTIGILFYFVTSLVVNPFFVDLTVYNIHI